MKAAIFRRFGGTEVLEVTDIDEPVPKPGEIRVRVRASSINQFECDIREGAFKILTGRRFPMITGHDIAGEVESLGEGSSRFQVDDRVFAMRKAFSNGAHAELAVVPESAAALIPADVSTKDAGVVPLAALTAWQVLHELGGLTAGQRVLINGAAGGVGSFAVQFACAAGAEVTGVCSQANADFVGNLGASEVIDYKLRDPTLAAGFDLVFDSVSKLPFSASRRMLKRGGAWVCTRFTGAYVKARLLAPLTERRVRMVAVKAKGDQLEQIGTLLANGKVQTLIEETYPITEMAAAHARSATGRVRGKIAIEVS